MFDINKAVDAKVDFYSRDRDIPWSVNGFKGTWQFTEHDTIPDTLHEFLMLSFSVGNIRLVPIDKINKLMNDVWEGPGSLEKLFRMNVEMRKAGKEIQFPMMAKARASRVIEEDEDIFPDLPLSNFGDEDVDEE